jgi:hypothetical protein
MQKCMYCHEEIHDDRPLTVCNKCGANIWGEKWFKSMVIKMEKARENGDLNFNSKGSNKDVGKFEKEVA